MSAHRMNAGIEYVAELAGTEMNEFVGAQHGAAVLHSAATPRSTATSASPVSRRLRLTRRGRVVLTTLAAVPVIAVAAYFGLNAEGAVASSTASSTAFEYVTIEAGESLWQVAVRIAPQSDPRDVIDQILDLNRLSSSNVVPGQQIAIPASYSSLDAD